MSWLRKERIKTINGLLEEIRKRGQMHQEDAQRFLMNQNFLSRSSAIRYIEELIFQGRLIRTTVMLSIPKPAAAPTPKETKT